MPRPSTARQIAEKVPVALASARFSRLADQRAESFAVLSGAEFARAARFVNEAARDQFILGRAFLRRELARHLGLAPEKIALTEGPAGRPELVHPRRISFNLSHSNDLVFLAVSEGGTVGVDVERVNPGQDLGIAKHVFSPEELALLSATDPAERVAEFFRLWTLKESFLKALGSGFQTSPASVNLALDAAGRFLAPNGTAWRLHHWREDGFSYSLCLAEAA
jgi:4'-phosphopantetheinyl transferase